MRSLCPDISGTPGADRKHEFLPGSHGMAGTYGIDMEILVMHYHGYNKTPVVP